MRQVSFTEKEKEFLISQLPLWEKQLVKNCRSFVQYPASRLLLAGEEYPGIWLEHNQDNIFLAQYAPQEAWASQDVFMHFQREDGLLPFAVPVDFSDPKHCFYQSRVCYWQLQSVYPFVRCAMEVARLTGQDIGAFERIYRAGCAYDGFLDTYRDHDKSGLCEMFCEYDTGHDHDARVIDGGIPHSCPGLDAANMPDLEIMPIESVDLSAMRYGMRTALAELAQMLGKSAEAEKWQNEAERTRQAIKSHFFDPETGFYFDRDRCGLRKYRTEHITRLFLNHVLTQEEFDAVYDRYFTVPGKEFCTDWPIPSVSVDDPCFDWDLPQNSWCGNTQALTALRTLFWMDHYGRSEDQERLLALWLRSYCDNPDEGCRQELDPFTGKPIAGGMKNYTPALIVMIQAVKRLWL